jgi:hypothetical protein
MRKYCAPSTDHMRKYMRILITCDRVIVKISYPLTEVNSEIISAHTQSVPAFWCFSVLKSMHTLTVELVDYE